VLAKGVRGVFASKQLAADDHSQQLLLREYMH
jgi:hypothetical protein